MLVRSREGSQPQSLGTEDPQSGERSRLGGIDKTSLSSCDFSFVFPGAPISHLRTETPKVPDSIVIQSDVSL